MLKNLSLSKKIAGGFIIILILLVVLAANSRFGLSRVVDKVDSANQFQLLVDHISKARQNEKNYILTNDSAASAVVKKEISNLKGQTQLILDETGSKEIKERASSIQKTSDQYIKTFDQYMDLAGKRDEFISAMDQKANAALQITSMIRDDQKSKYDKLRQESETKISQMRTRVGLAAKINESFLLEKGLRLVLTESYVQKVSIYSQWQASHENMKQAIAQLTPLATEEASQKALEKVKTSQEQLIAGADNYYEEKSEENIIKVIKAAKNLEVGIVYLMQEMQEQLEFYIEDVQIFSGQMMELSSGVDQIAKILLNTRILEKGFINTQSGEVFDKILSYIDSIDGIITTIVENVDDEDKTKPLEGIQTAVEEYIASFQSAAGLMQSQKSAVAKMESAAAAIQATCLAAKDAQYKQMQSQIVASQAVITFGSILALIIGGVLSWVIVRAVIMPIKTVVTALRNISEGEGDLTKRLSIETRDEMGALAHWFNVFIERIHNIIVDIGANSETVTASSGELRMISQEMAGGAEDLSSRSNSVSAAAEQMSSSMISVAAASEEASTNLTHVADSAGQMKSTLDEIASNCDKARNISDNATSQVKTASERVQHLGTSARDISKVTEVITDIAGQTNLLALNATIEAARAGEAGKGFAVVASEIKGLASQTAEATLDIKEKISGIQSSTDDTVKDVEQITGVIAEVSEIVSTIAAAIEEQSASASEVAENIEQASSGIGEVNKNVAQSSQVSSEIAENISAVNTVAEDISSRGTRMNTNAEDLSDLSKKLSKMIGVFKVSAQDAGIEAYVDKDSPPPEDLLPWSDRLISGIDSIDEQHKELVAMVNELHQAMRMKKGTEESGKILERLAQYTVDHFAYEATLFDEHQYPEADQHNEIHAQLVAKVQEFQQQFNEGKAALSMELMQFLTDWLENHILKTDREYVPYLQEKGVV